MSALAQSSFFLIVQVGDDWHSMHRIQLVSLIIIGCHCQQANQGTSSFKTHHDEWFNLVGPKSLIFDLDCIGAKKGTPCVK